MGFSQRIVEGFKRRIQVKPQTQVAPPNPGDFGLSGDFKLLKPDLREALQADTPVFEAGVYWEVPDVPFRVIYDYYKKDPGIQSAVNAYRNEIIGPGFYVTAEDEGAKKFLEDWNVRMGFERKLNILLGDTLILGCALAEVVASGSEMDIVPVDMRTIIAMQRDKFGNVKTYRQQTLNSSWVPLDPKDFIRFSHIEVGRMAWPIGIFHSAILPFFEFEGQPWSLADGAALMRQDALRLVHRMSAPRVWHVYENAGEEKLKAQKERDKLQKPGERGYVNQKFEVITEPIDGTNRFQDKIDFITNAFENALQAPTAKIMTATGISNATYASAQSAQEMFGKSIEGVKRQWEQQIEQQIYRPLLEMNGFDFEKAKPEFHWGVPDRVDVDINQIIALVSSGIMSVEEAREAVKQMNLPLSDDEQGVNDLRKEAYRKLIKKLDGK